MRPDADYFDVMRCTGWIFRHRNRAETKSKSNVFTGFSPEQNALRPVEERWKLQKLCFFLEHLHSENVEHRTDNDPKEASGTY